MTTTTRPGERLVAGKPYVFDLGLLTSHEADKACEAAPLDLSTLSDDDLRALRSHWLDRDARLRGDALTLALGRRIGDEFDRRRWDSAGRVVTLQRQLNALKVA